MRTLMIAIHPEHGVNILNLIKKLEVRSWQPKGELPIKVLIYITKGEPYLTWDYNMNHLGSMWKVFELHEEKDNDYQYLNGKVVAKFILNKAEDIIMRKICGEWEVYGSENGQDSLIQKSCLTQKEIFRYFKGNNGYAWKIDDLVIFDKPKELGEFYHYKKKLIDCGMDCPPYIDEVKVPLTKAPQKMVWVEE